MREVLERGLEVRLERNVGDERPEQVDSNLSPICKSEMVGDAVSLRILQNIHNGYILLFREFQWHFLSKSIKSKF